MRKKFLIKERIGSFKYAFNGLKILMIEEHNFRIHFIFSVIAVLLGIILKIDIIEWVFVCMSIALVVSMEAINSAIENLADFVSPEKNERIKKVKDISAFAVLSCAIMSLVVGCIVFIPKIIELFVK